MNLIRTALSKPQRNFLLPRCTIAIQQLSTAKDKHFSYNSWRDLVKNPMNWRDYREDKSIGLLKAKYPDFEHKTDGTALWLHSAPNWVLEEFNARKGKKEDSWKNLVENPDKWWDSRPRKTNVKYPDFVNKETGKGLYVDSSPEWALARLEGLEVAKQKKVDGWKNLVESPDKWFDNRPRKTNANAPDFRHKETGEALWLDGAPNWVFPGPKELNLRKRKKEDSWKNLVENPDKWFDNRPRKTNANTPDFRHKETNEGLWLDSSPNWVLSMLKN